MAQRGALSGSVCKSATHLALEARQDLLRSDGHAFEFQGGETLNTSPLARRDAKQWSQDHRLCLAVAMQRTRELKRCGAAAVVRTTLADH